MDFSSCESRGVVAVFDEGGCEVVVVEGGGLVVGLVEVGVEEGGY